MHLILLKLDDVTINSRTNRWWNDSSSHWINRVHWIEWIKLVKWSSKIIFDMRTKSIYIMISTLKSLWKEKKFVSFTHRLLIVSFDSFRDVQINHILINQRFENRERFVFDHEISRVIDFVYSFHFRNFSTFVWLSQAHDVNHETLFLSRVESYKTIV